MSSSEQIRKFAEGVKEKIKNMSADDIERAKQALHQALGEDVALLKGITYDQSLGKFHSIDAPASVIEKLRVAGLLKD